MHALNLAKNNLTPVKIYLVAYNLLSTLAWLNILYLTLTAVFSSSAQPASTKAKSWAGLFSQSSGLPSFAATALERLSNNYDYENLGWWTKWTQTAAVLEIVHSALGLVRSPVGTTAAQVASRLWTVWGVVEIAPSVSRLPSSGSSRASKMRT